MTAEVVLMNRQAVALAADSATTVTYWSKGKRELRFFKGANKIFNLSTSHPVGLMTYGTASLQGVPWEVVVKAFRGSAYDRPQGKLEGYAAALFESIEKNPNLFSETYLTEQFKTQVENFAFMICYDTASHDAVKNATDEKTRTTAATKALKTKRKVLDSSDLLVNATEEDIKTALTRHAKEVTESLAKNDLFKDWSAYMDLGEVVDLAIIGLFRKGISPLDQTGIVIAGYGEDEYFPSSIVYDCHGIVLGKVLFGERTRKSISHSDVSQIMPLAQSEMVSTFIYGISREAMKEVDAVFTKALDDFEVGACKDHEDRGKLKEQIKEQFSDGVLTALIDHHTIPLKRVVGNLPIDELAGLAETLISIESLKERVTRPTESVSGPIDVAVISKGDRFIWIKRKHYFDPALNPRYFTRSAPIPGS